MKHCEEYAALLDLYVDGELSPEDMARVQDHLDHCSACQSYVDDCLAIRAAFPSAEDTAVPDGFADAVMARIQAQAPASKKKQTTPWMKLLPALAACCVVVILLQSGPLSSARRKAAPASILAETAADEAYDASVPETAELPAASQELRNAGDPDASEKNAGSPVQDSAPTPYAAAQTSAYAAFLYLPPEGAEYLSAYAPDSEREESASYELSLQDVRILCQQLDAAGIPYQSESSVGSQSDLVLVVVSKS